MADYITKTGFDKPQLLEVIQQIGDSMESVVGPINREPDSTTGQWIGIESEANAIHFETAEELWLSRWIEYAEGAALDALGEWMGGIRRHGKTTTKVNAIVYGTESTPLPVNSLAGFGNYSFRLVNAAIISRSLLADGLIKVDNATTPSYTIRAVGVDHTYTPVTGDTAASIATALAALVDATTQFVSSANGSVVSITSENSIEGYPVSLSAGLSWQKIGSPALFEATEAGVIEVPAGGLNNPVSAITGWTAVNNLIPGATGTDRESDTDYRRRLKMSRDAAGGAATVPAIEGRLTTEVDGVTIAHVIENDTMHDINGQPPKSIHCIVQGGLEQSIANAIWQYKGAGISTYGDIHVTAYDQYGYPHLVMFSRPIQASIYVRVEVTLLDDEEELSQPIVTAIKDGVMNYAATLTLGGDVITQRIYGFIYSNTTGIGKMTITVSSDGVTYTEDNISIDEGSFASFDENNVEVTGV